MATEHEIRAAEAARLEAIVAEHGSDGERFELLLSGVMRNGVSVRHYASGEPLGHLPPEPEFLAQLARRVERRAALGLPSVECAGDPPTKHGCTCLVQALDEPGNGAKRHVLKRAAALHWSPPPRQEPRPADRRDEVEEPTPDPPKAREEAPAPPAPPPDPKPADATPPVRVIHRTRKWFDDFERPHFSDMKF